MAVMHFDLFSFYSSRFTTFCPCKHLRVLTFSGYDASADPLIEVLGWQKLESQRNFHKAVMVYKSLNGLAPEYMRSMFIH